MSNFDHYREADSIIQMLRGTSLSRYSDLLQSAMDEGATGTEIFMALRWNIEKLLNENNLDNLVRVRARHLWKELDKALQ
jgi:GTP cyclohydrolase FolE2